MEINLLAIAKREHEQLMEIATEWLAIPPDIFEEHGTAGFAIRVFSDDPAMRVILESANESLRKLAVVKPDVSPATLRDLGHAVVMAKLAIEKLEKGLRQEEEAEWLETVFNLGVMRGALIGCMCPDELVSVEKARKSIFADSVKRAAKGRRLIGATSRGKVAASAKNYQHLSKESAAPAIAANVGLSPATVRRYLTELFPGDSWKKL